MSRGKMSRFKVTGGPFHGKEIPLSASVEMAAQGEKVTFNFSASGFKGCYVKGGRGEVEWLDERAAKEGEACTSTS